MKSGSTPTNSNTERRVASRSPRRSFCSITRSRRGVEAQEPLDLHVVAAALEIGGLRMGEGLAQGAALAPLGVVVDPVRGDPLQRVAHEIDQPRVREELVHAPRHAVVLRIGGVVRRGLAANARGGVEVAPVPVEPPRPVALGDEEVELLRARHRDLRVQAQVVVKAARPALLGPDHDQVGQRAHGGAGAVAGRPRRFGCGLRWVRHDASPSASSASPTAMVRRGRGRSARISAMRLRRKES